MRRSTMEATSVAMGATSLALLVSMWIASTLSVSVIPHDAHPGYSVKKYNSGVNYRLLDSGFSQFFTMLEDGSIMTVSDVSPLVNRPIDLLVLEDEGNATKTHMLQLYVLDRRNMLSFKSDSDEVQGRVAENSPAGTKVEGLPVLQAASGLTTVPITYSIIGGNAAQAFELKHSVTGDVLQNVTVSRAKGCLWAHGARTGHQSSVTTGDWFLMWVCPQTLTRPFLGQRQPSRSEPRHRSSPRPRRSQQIRLDNTSQ